MMDEKTLGAKFEELGFSVQFVSEASAMGLTALSDVVDRKPAELLALPGFNFRWFTELLNWLDNNGQLQLLQSRPGNNAAPDA